MIHSREMPRGHGITETENGALGGGELGSVAQSPSPAARIGLEAGAVEVGGPQVCV